MVLQGLSRTVQTAMVSPFANCIVTAVREVCVPSVMVLLGPLNWASPLLSVTAWNFAGEVSPYEAQTVTVEPVATTPRP